MSACSVQLAACSLQLVSFLQTQTRHAKSKGDFSELGSWKARTSRTAGQQTAFCLGENQYCQLPAFKAIDCIHVHRVYYFVMHACALECALHGACQMRAKYAMQAQWLSLPSAAGLYPTHVPLSRSSAHFSVHSSGQIENAYFLNLSHTSSPFVLSAQRSHSL